MEIKIKNLEYSYNNKKVFDNMSVIFPTQKINAIIGRNGSGKTTLLRMIKSLIIPDEGYINIGKYVIGQELDLDVYTDHQLRIGYVSQYPEEHFICDNVNDELEFSLRFYGFKEKEIKDRVKGVIKMVGLDDSILKKDISSLCKGEKKLVSIANALVFNPKVLLLDEPTNGLDNDYIDNIVKLLKMLKNKYNKTILISSHDSNFVLKVSDNVFVLDNGKIVLSGDKYDILSKYDELKKYNLECPKIIEVSYKALKNKGIKMGYRDEVNDLLKDIYRYVK